MANLPFLYLTGMTTNATLAFTGNVANTVEDFAAPNGLVISSSTTPSVTGFQNFSITDFPTNFKNITTLGFRAVVRRRAPGLIGDSDVLTIMIVNGGSIYTDTLTVAASPAKDQWWYVGPLYFTIQPIAVNANKASWDAAEVTLTNTFSKSGGVDNTYWEIDCFHLLGSYVTSTTLKSVISSATGLSTTNTIRLSLNSFIISNVAGDSYTRGLTASTYPILVSSVFGESYVLPIPLLLQAGGVILTAPSNNFNTALPILFDWEPYGVYTVYQLQIALDINFNSIVLDRKVTGTSLVVNTLNTTTTYYWRVRAIGI